MRHAYLASHFGITANPVKLGELRCAMRVACSGASRAERAEVRNSFVVGKSRTLDLIEIPTTFSTARYSVLSLRATREQACRESL
jgi:hypothetical protein